MPGFTPLLAASDDIVRLAYQTHEYSSTSFRTRDAETGNLAWDELRWNEGSISGVPPISFSIKHRPRGEFMSKAAGWTVGLCIGLLAPFALAPALRWGAPMLGNIGSKVASSLLTIYPAVGLGRFTSRAVRYMANYDYHIRRIEMGGDYQDSVSAAALRFVAIRNMSAAFGSARGYLGREALYLSN
jgi:hypothetical protein